MLRTKKVTFYICILLLLSFIPEVSYGQALYKIVAPKVSNLTNYQKREGELAFDSATKSLKIYRGSRFEAVTKNLKEVIPRVTKRNSSYISIGPGKILIGDKLYTNTNFLYCSMTTQGVGGYDTDLPTLNPINYLYLIPNEIVPGAFTCIISHLDDGPSTYSGPFRRVVSFISSENFTSENGLTDYQTTSVSSYLAPNGPTDCTEVVLPYLPPSAYSYLVMFDCPSFASSGHYIYSDSSCSAASQINQCAWSVNIRSTAIGMKLYRKDFSTPSFLKIYQTYEKIQ